MSVPRRPPLSRYREAQCVFITRLIGERVLANQDFERLKAKNNEMCVTGPMA